MPPLPGEVVYNNMAMIPQTYTADFVALHHVTRPEEYILEQLEEMWEDIRTRQSRLEEQIRHLHKHLLPNEIVAPVTTVVVARKNSSIRDEKSDSSV